MKRLFESIFRLATFAQKRPAILGFTLATSLYLVNRSSKIHCFFESKPSIPNLIAKPIILHDKQ